MYDDDLNADDQLIKTIYCPRRVFKIFMRLKWIWARKLGQDAVNDLLICSTAYS